MFTMKMSDEEHAALKAAAKSAGVGMADLVRAALADWARGPRSVAKSTRAPRQTAALSPNPGQAVSMTCKHKWKDHGWATLCELCKEIKR